MDLIEKATIIHYHRRRISGTGGGTVEALGWKAKESQTKRFDVLSTVGDLNGCSVLDVGCGYGDLKGHLDRHFTEFFYIGIDQMSEFIDRANARYGDCTDTHFCQTDFSTVAFPRVDYVVACGSLGYRCNNPAFYGDMIRKMFAAATRALAFNMLDASRFPEHPLLVGHDREQVVAFCRTLSPSVKLISGYLEDDFTVFIYH